MACLSTAPLINVDAYPAPATTANVDVEAATLERVAVEVETLAPVADSDVPGAQRILLDNLIVYSRRPRSDERSDEPTTPATVFIDKITKKVEAVVPVPGIPKRRAKTAGPVSMPRRSRRIANLPPETDFASASTICRKLGLADEEGKISEEALNRYAKFYNHLLSREDVAALSALFGWDVPLEGQAHVADGSATLS
ncbi:unnamed protein product [Urochloa humidicola]